MSIPQGFIGAFLFLILVISPIVGQENLPVLIKKVEPSIVVIFTYNKEGKNLGQGSGFFINKEGDVITNSHVLQEASRATVRTTDGKDYSVKKVLVEDKEGDLIRISVDIPGEAVRPLPVTTKLPDVGEKIIVIVTPLGLDKTVSDGIVSAVREIPAFGKIIQVTAPISPGSSGSPVINMKGEVIGIATFFCGSGSKPQLCYSWREDSKTGHGSGNHSFGARRRKNERLACFSRRALRYRTSFPLGRRI